MWVTEYHSILRHPPHHMSTFDLYAPRPGDIYPLFLNVKGYMRMSRSSEQVGAMGSFSRTRECDPNTPAHHRPKKQKIDIYI